MNETMICAVGNVATRPMYRDPASGVSARFRLAVTSRYWDRERNAWTDGHTNFFTVWANRQLAANAMASLNVGDPVVVQGRLKVRTESRDGNTRTWADIDAVAIGHDLARGTSAFRRTGRPEPTTPPAPAQPEPAWETPTTATDRDTDTDTAANTTTPTEALPDTPSMGTAADAGAMAGEARQRREPVAVT
ncbi:single-stranded DNA-binding protein [Streptomyces carpinensis]|uniref:single-stranded DNA-binding protein n=1 Tax=Streptomyces carpinensis TaxID=66369 RepID=UPI000A387C97|nr:single-stranded DNA-binding protein [Streptomyces carpinensis]